MKRMILIVPPLLLAAGVASGTVIYSNDFSGATAGGWYRTTRGGGSSGFHDSWSVDNETEEDAGNRYGRVTIEVPAPPDDPGVTWEGGFYARITSPAAIPPQWELTFEVLLPTTEPVRVTLMANDEERTHFGFTLPVWDEQQYWVYPAGAGWQTLSIDHTTPSAAPPYPRYATRVGTIIRIGLASHGPDGEPQAISAAGTHTFLIDNIVYRVVPEPSVLCLLLLGGLLTPGRRRTRPE